jgi:uncharacterized protein (DUF2141 family)
MAITLSGDGISSDAIASLAASKLTGQVPDANAPSGSVIQVVSATSQTTNGTTSTSRIDSGFSVSITPTSTSSKILVLFNTYGAYVGGGALTAFLYRNGSNTIPSDRAWFEVEGSGYAPSAGSHYLDSPSSTSSVTYKIYYRSTNGSSVYILNNGPDYGIMSFTVMEIAA